MTREQLYDSFLALSPTQIAAVVYKLEVPQALLPATPPAAVIIAALHWAEQHGRLEDVARLIAKSTAFPLAVAPALAAAGAPDAGSVSPLRQAVDELDVLLLENRRAAHRPPEEAKQAKDRIERLAGQIVAGWSVSRGSIVGGALLERKIGTGNFGSVWYGTDLATGAPRAVKIFHIDNLTSGLMLWRFRRSIRALKRLSERPRLRKRSDDRGTVVTFYEEDESSLAFSMEYLPGGSLDEIAKLQWSLAAKMAAMVKICAAVAYGHENGIVHRDIKPANVVLDVRYEPVLTDFDIADIKFVTSLSTVVEGGLGTPVFAAPEQLRDGDAADERSDVYSLGRVLHFILIEQSPGIEIEKEPELRNLRDFPPGLVEVVRRATHPLPGRRFVNVRQMLGAIEQSLTGEAARAARLGALRRWTVRNAVLLGAMLTISGSGVGFGLHEHKRALVEQALRNEARTQEARALGAAQELAADGKELARLSEKVRAFQTDAMTLVSRRDALIESIRALAAAKPRERFEERLSHEQDEFYQVLKQIDENKNQQLRLQRELAEAENRVRRQTSTGTPLVEDAGAPPVEDADALSAQEPASKCPRCDKELRICRAKAGGASLKYAYCNDDFNSCLSRCQ